MLSTVFERPRMLMAISLGALHAITLTMAILAKEPLPSWEPCPSLGLCIEPGSAAGETLVANRVFHFHYEDLLTKSLMVADMPALCAGDILLLPFTILFPLDSVVISYLQAASWVVFGSLQWVLIANWAHSRIAPSLSRAAWVRR